MENNKIEIKLDFAENVDVKLENMSMMALESFLKVTNALKNIAEIVSDEFTFSLKNGSASASVIGTPQNIYDIYNKMDEAIEGESEDEVVTANMRIIQAEIKNEALRYQFYFSNQNIEERLKNAGKIIKKKSFKNYAEEIRILTGKFKTVGGDKINYHLEYGSGEKYTIDCSEDEALELKDYLFKTISCIVLKKINLNDPNKLFYKHCVMIQDNQISKFRTFFNDYLNASLMDRLERIYDFVDNTENLIDDLSVLLKASTNVFKDVNESKTLLIITKNLTEFSEIKVLRENLALEFDNRMMEI